VLIPPAMKTGKLTMLTGAMAIWAYLAVFHLLHGKTRRIYYQDGRGERLLVAAHG